MTKNIRVLVVDDSAYNRKAIREMLSGEVGIEVVGVARDGEEGLRQLRRMKPDLVTLDLEMPGMDGFTFLRIVMNQSPLPILVVSSRREAISVFRALELGAVDFLPKPSRTISPDLYNIREELVRKVRSASEFRIEGIRERMVTPSQVLETDLSGVPREQSTRFRLVVIGASTGGPGAIARVMTTLKAGLPLGMVVSQHMPPGFTRAFADRLDRFSLYSIHEAEDGEKVAPQCGYICPGGKNISLEQRGGDVQIRLKSKGRERYIPSVDLLFESASRIFRQDCMGIVLTGMGSDGREGVVSIKRRGGVTVAESEETSVVFGMPREAIATGEIDQVLPLGSISRVIAHWAQGGKLGRR